MSVGVFPLREKIANQFSFFKDFPFIAFHVEFLPNG